MTINTWFTSDLHFGHLNILKYRDMPGVETIEEHDEFLIERWNSTVGPSDHVYVLGDFAMGKRADTVPTAARLNGHKILVPGNHDYVWPGFPKYTKWDSLYRPYFTIMDPEFIMHIGDAVVISHFPYLAIDRHDNRYDDWSPEDMGNWLVHGHVHDAYKVRGRQINVGVDVWKFAPVPLEHLAEIVRGKDPT